MPRSETSTLELKPGHAVYGSGPADDIIIQDNKLYMRSGGVELPLDAVRIKKEFGIEPHPGVKQWILDRAVNEQLAKHATFLNRMADSVKANLLERLEKGELNLDGVDIDAEIEKRINAMIGDIDGESKPKGKGKTKTPPKTPAKGSTIEENLDDDDDIKVED